MSRNLGSRTNLGVIKGKEIWSMRAHMVILKYYLHLFQSYTVLFIQ